MNFQNFEAKISTLSEQKRFVISRFDMFFYGIL